jgi:hypothetical protein
LEKLSFEELVLVLDAGAFDHLADCGEALGDEGKVFVVD